MNELAAFYRGDRPPTCLLCNKGVEEMQHEHRVASDQLRIAAKCHGEIEWRTIDGVSTLAHPLEQLPRTFFAKEAEARDRKELDKRWHAAIKRSRRMTHA